MKNNEKSATELVDRNLSSLVGEMGSESVEGRRITMTDVARAASCSQATVSFVLNNVTGVKISEATRARVIKIARDMNYAPGALAHHHSNLPRVSPMITDSVGFIVDQLATSPEAVVAIEGVRQALWDSSRIVLMAQTMNDPEMEEKTIAALLQQGVSSLIYMTIFTRRVELPRWISELQIPVVLLNCYCSSRQYPSAVPSEVEGGYRATHLLTKNGHHKIGLISGEPWMEASRHRLKGYRLALTKAGIAFDHTYVMQGNWSASSGYECTKRLLALPNRPTAIFCQNDRMAIGCYEALKEAGLRIPQDVSVVGYDDEEISRHLTPQLSTVILPHRTMGHWAVQRLDELQKNKKESFDKELIDCILVERDSVGPAKDNNSVTLG